MAASPYNGSAVLVMDNEPAQLQVGQQVPTIAWEEGLKVYDKNKDGKIAETEVTGGPPALDKMLSPKYGFPAFDGNRDGMLEAADWAVMRAMLAAENGLSSRSAVRTTVGSPSSSGAKAT